jgi:hypothetical protein
MQHYEKEYFSFRPQQLRVEIPLQSTLLSTELVHESYDDTGYVASMEDEAALHQQQQTYVEIPLPKPFDRFRVAKRKIDAM